MRTLIFLLFALPALAQLPTSGSLSLKSAAGAGRSISQQVDGNETGSKSLLTLSVTAGKTAPHSMLEFYGFPAGPPLPGSITSCTSALNQNTNGGVDLSWTNPASGGTPEHTRIEVSVNGGAFSLLTTVNYPGSTYNYRSGLISGSTYAYRFYAVNATGDGTVCGPTATITFPSLPNAPSSATLENVYPDGLNVTWTAPVGGGTVVNYSSVLYKPGDIYVFDFGTSSPTTSGNYAHSLLVSGQDYYVKVSSGNAAGNSSPTQSSTITYAPPPIPSAPANVSAAINGTFITVSWDPAASGDQVDTYRVERSIDGSAFSLYQDVNGSETSVNAPYLPGHSYIFRVRAQNISGNSAYTMSGEVNT